MTTARQVWNNLLIKLSKVGSPSILLSEFNTLANQAIYQTINKFYAEYETTQQTTDNLRVLKANTTLEPKPFGEDWNLNYYVDLPVDYLHILRCTCIYDLGDKRNCDNKKYIKYPATKLTSESYSKIEEDYYNRPLYKRPYFYINNKQNSSSELPTNSYDDQESGTVDQTPTNEVPKFFTFNNKQEDLTTNPSYQRHANPTKVRCEIICGDIPKGIKLSNVFIEYIKAPQKIKLTKQQLDLVSDTSQVLEFPDYVCIEIENELTMLVMSRSSDPRLGVQMQVTQSIANPIQQASNSPKT